MTSDPLNIESWGHLAACAGVDPELFYPGRGEDTQPAKTVCASCPVRARCLLHAIATTERWGVWGCASERERRQLRGRITRERRTRGNSLTWWRLRTAAELEAGVLEEAG